MSWLLTYTARIAEQLLKAKQSRKQLCKRIISRGLQRAYEKILMVRGIGSIMPRPARLIVSPLPDCQTPSLSYPCSRGNAIATGLFWHSAIEQAVDTVYTTHIPIPGASRPTAIDQEDVHVMHAVLS